MEPDIYKKSELAIKTLTLFGVLIAAIWAYHTYTDTKEKEFYSQFWNTKLSLYLETSGAASTMATTKSVKKFVSARDKYEELFFGRLSLVEGQSVKKAMEIFYGRIPSGEVKQEQLPFHGLQQDAYQLTIALKKELGTAWREPFSEL